MSEIYVFGSLNTDMTIECARMPEAGETLAGGGFLTTPGGKGANQAVACARLGGRTHFCGRAGDDLFGKRLRGNLEEAGVDCAFLRADAEHATGVAVIIVTEGNNRIILDAGANAAVTEEDARAFLAEAKEGDVFLAQAEVPLPVLRAALSAAKEKGMRVLFNPAPAVGELKDLVRFGNIILPNETELAILTGEEKAEEGAAALSACGADVLVTLGSRGCYWQPKGGQGRYFPCEKVKAVDTTAAGDTFCGGLAVMLAEGAGMEEAIAFASRAASLSVTRRGAQASIPFRSELGKNF